MKHRYTIAHKGLKEGTHQYHFEVGDGFWAGREASGIKGGNAVVDVELKKGAATELKVHIAGGVVVPCDRCLEDCELPVDYRGRLVVKTSEEEQPFEGDILWTLPGETTLDLEQYIYESIVLSLPLQRVHPEDVHGRPLCNPAMLDRFRIVTEDEWEQMNNDGQTDEMNDNE